MVFFITKLRIFTLINRKGCVKLKINRDVNNFMKQISNFMTEMP